MSHSSIELDRLEILWWSIAAVGVVLGLRLVQLQIIDSAQYRLAAERNRSQLIYQNAPRGRIFDRDGREVATNRPAFSVSYLPPSKGQAPADLVPLSKDLAHILGGDSTEIRETLEQAERDESVVRLAENLPQATMFRISELKTLYPGIDPHREARRYYPYGRFASHLIGFMGRMNAREWRERKTKGYRPDARIGKMGLESAFEEEMRGHDGGIRMEVDAQGRLKGALETIEGTMGNDLYLTVDSEVQRAADEGIRGTSTGVGAAVAIDPRNGEILAMSSQPDFDPNALLSSDPEEVKRNAADLPEFNKAIAGVYPPGSTFKPIVGLAAMNEGKVTPDDAFYCPGYYELGNHIFLCWDHKGHKRISWLMGLALSCDVYFWNIGLRTRGDTIERYERAFGLGSKTNIALRGEKSGHVFGPDARHRSKRGWYDGDTLNLSIGQGELLVTPIQMAVVTAALASRGVLWRPHYTQKIVYEDGRPTYVQAPERLPDNGLNIKDSVWDDVQRALEVTVSSGTGTPASIPGLMVAGKTGTAQNPHGEDHAWFIAYAAKPGEAASIAVAVLIENGGHGGVTAAPVARKMILAHFKMKDPLIEKAERAAARAAAREARLAPPTPLLNTPGVPR